MTKQELQEVIRSKETEFEGVISAAKEAKRELTEDEVTLIDTLKAERADVSSQIESLDAEEAKRALESKEAEKEALRAELKEELEAEIKRQKEEKEEATKRDLENLNNKQKNMKENKLFEAFRSNFENGDRGAIVAQRDALDGDTSVMGNVIPNYIADLDILGYEPIWKQMGTDVLSGAKGTFTLPFEDPIIGELALELVPQSGDIVTPDGILIKPKRFTVRKTFTVETLSSATDNFLQSVLGDMVKGCDRAITKEVYAKALAVASVIAGSDITKTGFDALMAGAEVELDGAFLANRKTFFEAKALPIDAGSGRFLVERAGNVNIGQGVVYDGTPFWYSNLFEDGVDQKYVVYGDTSKIFVADYGMVEIIVDKYTMADTGQVVITVNKLADVAVKNPIAFAKTADLDPA